MGNLKDKIDIWIMRQHTTNNANEALGGIMKYYGVHGVDLAYYKTGKPYFKKSDFKISIARRNRFAVYALAYRDEIGVDIEEIRLLPDMENLSRYIFNKSHVRDIVQRTGTDKMNAFYRYWTTYEACAKFTGEGLAKLLQKKSIHRKKMMRDAKFSYTFKTDQNYMVTVVSGKKRNVWVMPCFSNKIKLDFIGVPTIDI